MVRRDPNTLDLTHQKLRMSEDVMVWPVRERGELVYRIEIPKLHRFFRVGYEEYVFISLLDGKTSIPQACGLAAATLGSRAPTAAQAGVIGRWLLQNELAYLDTDGPPIRRAQAVSAQSSQSAAARLLGRLNPFWMKLPLPRGQRWMNVAAKIFRPILAPQSVTLGLLVVVAAIVVLLARWTEFVSFSANLFHPSNWIWLLVTWIVLKLIHELAHAVACERHGGTVRESGIVFVLFAPLAYVDVTSCWRMNSRWSRIAVAAAGMYVELLIAAAAVLLWTMVDAPNLRFLLHNLVFTAGLSTLLFNANVLMRFDGYFILADLIEVPNLYSEGSSALRRLVKRVATGEQAGGGSIGGWRKHFVLGYGLAAFCWRVTICVSLAIAASTMFAGAGIAITALGILTWLGRPIRQLIRFGTELRGRDPHRFLRAAGLSVVSVGVSCWMLFCLPIPTSVEVPAISRYLPETLVRSRASGFVSKIHVADGALVRQGDLLVELENRELSNRLRQLEIASAQNELRLRRATDQHDEGERNILRANQRSLAEQIEQMRSQTSGLRVTAPRSGRVVARGLEATLGTYVNEGDSILVVASEADKEIVAVISQDVIEEVRGLVGTSVPVRTAGFVATSGRLDRVEPRADNRLPDPSLAASEGGALAVQAADKDDERGGVLLLEPHFRGRIGLAPEVAAKVPAGMRLQASFGYRAEPIASRAAKSMRRLWHAAHDEASSY